VNEVEIQRVEPESAHTRLESRFDALGPVIGIPQADGKDILAVAMALRGNAGMGLDRLS
jgi:hypothetical protein